MADDVRQILIQFVTDVKDMNKGAEAVKQGMGDAAEGMDVASKAAGFLKTAAINAGIAAGQMALEWAIAGVDMATEANKIAKNFDGVFGPAAASLDDEIVDLAGHMGLTEHEAQQLLATTGALAQSMGMSQQESADYSAEMFKLAGDMAAFNPEAGTAADAMEDLTKAANGSTKGMAAWGVSLKSSEINARALANTGKETTSQLTQEEKALATLQLTQEKTAASQGALNDAMESGSTEVKEAKADIADMQVEVGNALMPIKKLALQGFLILADILIALQPAIEAIGEVLGVLGDAITSLMPLVSAVAKLLGGVLSVAVKTLIAVLQPLLDLIRVVGEALGDLVKDFDNFKMPNINIPSLPRFHSGGTVPGVRGQEVPIMAQAGERVSGGHSSGGGGGGGTVVNITVQAGISDPQAVARKVADMLTEYTAVNGPINVKTRG